MLYHQKPKYYLQHFLGYQVMASNVLYKTKSTDGLESETRDVNDARNRPENTIYDRNAIKTNNRDLTLEDQEKFAADFQRQHHQHRWGQGIDIYLYFLLIVVNYHLLIS